MTVDTTGRDAPWRPANDTEEAMAQAIAGKNRDAYLAVLAAASLRVLIHGAQFSPVRPPRWRTAVEQNRVFMVAFTSREAMRTVIGQVQPHLLLDISGLATDWPDPDWGLAVDPGLPIGSRLPQHMVHQLAALGAGPSGPSGPQGSQGPPRSAVAPVSPPIPVPVPAPPVAAQPVSAPGPVAATSPVPVSPPPGLRRGFQVVLSGAHVARYLEDGHDRVSGIAYRETDIAGLDPTELATLPGGPPPHVLAAEDGAVHVIRWPAFGADAYKPVPGGPLPRRAVTGARLPNGARLVRIGPDGVENVAGEFDAVARRWRPDHPPTVDPYRGQLDDGWWARYGDGQYPALPGPNGVHLYTDGAREPRLVGLDEVRSLSYRQAWCRWRGDNYTVVGIHNGWLRLERLSDHQGHHCRLHRAWAPEHDIEDPHYVKVDALPTI
jgi:hypothetical protein